MAVHRHTVVIPDWISDESDATPRYNAYCPDPDRSHAPLHSVDTYQRGVSGVK